MKRFLLALGLVVALVASMWSISALPVHAAPDQTATLSCSWEFFQDPTGHYSYQGHSLSVGGQTCIAYDDPAPNCNNHLCWQVSVETDASGYVNNVTAGVDAQDRCGTGAWIVDMNDVVTRAGTSITDGPVDGTYHDCTNGHAYRNYSAHYAEPPGSSNAFGGLTCDSEEGC